MVDFAKAVPHDQLVRDSWSRCEGYGLTQHSTPSFHRAAEPKERGAEVMSPLRQTMRFVDHKQIDCGPPQGREEFRVLEPFGCGEHELHLAGANGRETVRDLALGHVRVDLADPHTQLRQLVGLVLHQRDERGYDDRGAWKV